MESAFCNLSNAPVRPWSFAFLTAHGDVEGCLKWLDDHASVLERRMLETAISRNLDDVVLSGVTKLMKTQPNLALDSKPGLSTLVTSVAGSSCPKSLDMLIKDCPEAVLATGAGRRTALQTACQARQVENVEIILRAAVKFGLLKAVFEKSEEASPSFFHSAVDLLLIVPKGRECFRQLMRLALDLMGPQWIWGKFVLPSSIHVTPIIRMIDRIPRTSTPIRHAIRELATLPCGGLSPTCIVDWERACDQPCFACLKVVLARKDKDGNDALVRAAKAGLWAVVTDLASLDLPLDDLWAFCELHQDVFYHVVKCLREEHVRKLLLCGRSPLVVAADRGYWDVVQELCRKGASEHDLVDVAHKRDLGIKLDKPVAFVIICDGVSEKTEESEFVTTQQTELIGPILSYVIENSTFEHYRKFLDLIRANLHEEAVALLCSRVVAHRSSVCGVSLVAFTSVKRACFAVKFIISQRNAVTYQRLRNSFQGEVVSACLKLILQLGTCHIRVACLARNAFALRAKSMKPVHVGDLDFAAGGLCSAAMDTVDPDPYPDRDQEPDARVYLSAFRLSMPGAMWCIEKTLSLFRDHVWAGPNARYVLQAVSNTIEFKFTHAFVDKDPEFAKVWAGIAAVRFEKWLQTAPAWGVCVERQTASFTSMHKHHELLVLMSFNEQFHEALIAIVRTMLACQPFHPYWVAL